MLVNMSLVCCHDDNDDNGDKNLKDLKSKAGQSEPDCELFSGGLVHWRRKKACSSSF